MTMLYFVTQSTMFFTIPLIIVALGGLFSEKSGVVNIALEGIMIMGAFTGTLFIHTMQNHGTLSGMTLLILGLLIGMVTGIVVSLLHAYASINLKANQIISGVAINMFAPAFAVYTARLVLGSQNIRFYNQFRIDSVPFLGNISVFRVESVPLLNRIPAIGSALFQDMYITTYIGLVVLIVAIFVFFIIGMRIALILAGVAGFVCIIPFIGPMFFQNAYITTLLGFVILAVASFVLYKTKFGLRLRACGEYPQAADSVGVSVAKMRYSGVLISGALAGLGGVVFVIPITTVFDGTVVGYGFLALAVLIFGAWKPKRILFAAIFFGLMKTIAHSHSAIGFLNALPIPSHFYSMLPFIATLVVLAFTSKNTMAPKAAGQPYDKGGR